MEVHVMYISCSYECTWNAHWNVHCFFPNVHLDVSEYNVLIMYVECTLIIMYIQSALKKNATMNATFHLHALNAHSFTCIECMHIRVKTTLNSTRERQHTRSRQGYSTQRWERVEDGDYERRRETSSSFVFLHSNPCIIIGY